MSLDALFIMLTHPWPAAVIARVSAATFLLLQSPEADVNRITARFLQFGQGIAAGICALAILAGFVMIGASHGNPARAEHGRAAIVAGLVGLIGVALVGSLVGLVTSTFPNLGSVPVPPRP